MATRWRRYQHRNCAPWNVAHPGAHLGKCLGHHALHLIEWRHLVARLGQLQLSLGGFCCQLAALQLAFVSFHITSGVGHSAVAQRRH